jgi:hypothetical protein
MLIAADYVEQSSAARAEFDDYVKSVAAPGGALGRSRKPSSCSTAVPSTKPSSTP